MTTRKWWKGWGRASDGAAQFFTRSVSSAVEPPARAKREDGRNGLLFFRSGICKFSPFSVFSCFVLFCLPAYANDVALYPGCIGRLRVRHRFVLPLTSSRWGVNKGKRGSAGNMRQRKVQRFFFSVKTKRPNLLRSPQRRTTQVLQIKTSETPCFFKSSSLMRANTNKLQLCCAVFRAGVTLWSDKAGRFKLLLCSSRMFSLKVWIFGLTVPRRFLHFSVQHPNVGGCRFKSHHLWLTKCGGSWSSGWPRKWDQHEGRHVKRLNALRLQSFAH